MAMYVDITQAADGDRFVWAIKNIETDICCVCTHLIVVYFVLHANDIHDLHYSH